MNEPKAPTNEIHTTNKTNPDATADSPAPAEPAPAEQTPVEPTPAVVPTDVAPSAAPVVVEPAAPSLLALPGATVQVMTVSADGLRLGELACEVDSMPLFGTLAIIASLAKQDRALDRCAPKGDAAIATWTFAAGRTSAIEVERGASPKVDACLRAALKKVSAPFDARCSAVLLIGADAGADAGLTRLREGAAGR